MKEIAINPDTLADRVKDLQHEALELERKFAPAVAKTHPDFRKSARNLLHYLALRQHDIRDLQFQLAQLGLSSLGRAESHVLASLEAVRTQLCVLRNCESPQKHNYLTFDQSSELLKKNTEALLGEAPTRRNSRIMVTLATEMATDYELVRRLMLAGMNCARLNCAHDDESTWLKMISNVRKAERELKMPCKVLMDLMGPKLRTGPLKDGPRLTAIHPIRDEQGRVVSPVNVWLAPAGVEPPFLVDARLPVAAKWLSPLQEGDVLHFTDTRGRKRQFSIARKTPQGLVAHLFKTAYIAAGTRLKLKNRHAKKSQEAIFAEIGELAPIQVPIRLKKDDFLILNSAENPGEPAVYDAAGHVIRPAHISCTLPDVFKRVKVGQPILFDDGKIEGEIQEVSDSQLLVKITAAGSKGSKLAADKGINLPDSELHILALTEKDKQDLAFVVKHADIVNLSFVNHPVTVFELQAELEKHQAAHVAIMLKIETKEAFRNLPHLLLAAMKLHPAGIMIARGDLAVECGWNRLAEVQEEILWLSEAAHIPVVWATQVLETLAKKGRPSRAEITDAAMAQRADCVMLNKGPHVVQAIELLDNILSAMQQHQYKKTSMLRNLHVSELEKTPQPVAGRKAKATPPQS